MDSHQFLGVEKPQRFPTPKPTSHIRSHRHEPTPPDKRCRPYRKVTYARWVVPRQSRPNEKSCNPPPRAVGQNYLTIGRALKRLGALSRWLNYGTSLQANPIRSPVCWSSIIRQLGRSDGANRPGPLETRLNPNPWTELCPPEFPFLGPSACGLHGNSEHSPTAGA